MGVCEIYIVSQNVFVFCCPVLSKYTLNDPQSTCLPAPRAVLQLQLGKQLDQAMSTCRASVGDLASSVSHELGSLGEQLSRQGQALTNANTELACKADQSAVRTLESEISSCASKADVAEQLDRTTKQVGENTKAAAAGQAENKYAS